MYIMRRIDAREMNNAEMPAAITAYNKMHAGMRIAVEWGIGGLKRKWKRLMKGFDSTKPKFPDIFTAAAILTNFLHRRRRTFREEVQQNGLPGIGWGFDF